MSESQSHQAALPGLEPGTTDEWIVTVTDGGLEYTVLIEAMTRREARETFSEEFYCFEVGVEDEDFDFDHEVVYARSQEDAEKIALSREREYMRTYQAPNLGQDADVLSVDRPSQVHGRIKRRTKRDAEAIANE